MWRVGMACLLSAGGVAAQSPGPAPAQSAVLMGTRVRVWERAAASFSIPVVGTLAGLTADTVSIRPDGGAAIVGIARPLVTHVESSAGPGTGGRTTGAWHGAIMGGLAGAILGIVVGDMSRHNAVKLGSYGAIGGALGGAAIGATRPGDAWQDAALPPPRPADR
jgi:hypothetical protein